MKKIVVFIALMFFLAVGVFAQQKFALVIGNGAYTNFGTLRNPVNDANDVAAALQKLGWTVDKVLNGNLAQMENAAIRLKNRLTEAGKNSYGFFFYAGHGVQMDGVNYLIPADANIPDRNFLRERALSVQVMLGMLNDASNALNIVVLDACRDFPVAWTKSTDRGLAVIAAPPADSIIMYATGAGRTASDGTGKNGLFTTYLLNNMQNLDLEVNEVFRRTMGDVQKASNGQQRPALYTDFSETAYLGNKPQVTTTQTTQPQQTTTPPVQTTQPQQTTQPAAKPETPAPAGFVYIQGGTFTMGSPANEPNRGSNEGPQHQVTVSSFYMGKYEVTQKEYQEIMGTNPSYSKGDNLPVETVSWFDAIEYCNKRSQKEGLTPAYSISGTGDNRTVSWNRNANGYRLPTEAEWEYACRAGTTTVYNTGANINDNTGWYNSNSGRKTHPVGQKSANAWGLYDMHGNVWEWCWDWYGDYSSGSQTDPMGASSGTDRVHRGGCWGNSAGYLRSAIRDFNDPSCRYGSLGFRLVRP